MPRPSSSSSSSSGDDDVRPATTRQKKTNESQHQSPITASRQQKQKTVDPSSSASSPSSSGWFKIPAPLARLFNRFPLLTYPPNELPVRSPTQRNLPALYVFISEEDALRGLPSFNPSCLKWQTFLKLAGVDFRVLSSNNHASPTGALPFLIPYSSAASSSFSAPTPTPIPSNKLEQWVRANGTNKHKPPPAAETADHHDLPTDTTTTKDSARLDAYEALLDHRLRPAWLRALYLSRGNAALLSRLYAAPATASPAVRAVLLHQLRRAAEAEVRKLQPSNSAAAALYAGAREAFAALEAALVGEDDEEEDENEKGGAGRWFFGAKDPGLFDPPVFSYTHLLLPPAGDGGGSGGGGLAWGDCALGEVLREFPALVRHRDAVLRRCWPEVLPLLP